MVREFRGYENKNKKLNIMCEYAVDSFQNICTFVLHWQDQLMETMDVAKDPAVKMKGEDLAHAYDAVRVANKSVSPPCPSPPVCKTFALPLSCLICASFSSCVQVSGEPAAWPAQSAGGGAESAAAAD